MRTGSTLLRERADQTTRPDPVVRQRLTDLGLGWRLVALVLLGVTIVLYVLRGALPVTPFSTPGSLQTDYARVFAPQGWSFFTYNPRAPHLSVLGRDAATGAWSVLHPGRLAVPEDLMGLNRIRQAMETDARLLLPQVPDKAWVECEREALDCLSELEPGPVVTNSSPRHDFCGDIGLIMQEVVPWAWREFPTTMPSRVVRVTATC
jgi:antimicrobial peptide system SdpA family protein